ncbi:MAG: hypothetical protein FK731_08185 [Asgard group archaeon]|nr:hypothetical protein [Asgard group archaeon]
MKKALKIILPLLMIGMILSIQEMQAAYNISVGSIYNYNVNASSTDIKLGINEANIEGFTLDGQDFGINTEISLNVTSVLPTAVLYNISVGEYSEEASSTILDPAILLSMMFFPIEILEEVTLNEWNQSDIEDLHLGVLMVPFLSVTSTTWSDWIDIVNEINVNGTLESETFGEGLTLKAKYTNTTDNFIVEFNMRGDLSENITSIDASAIVDVSINHKYLFAYTKASGVMLGIKMEGEISGFSDGTLLEIGYSYNTEKVDYDLPEFELDRATWPFPGLGFWLTLSSIGFIAILIHITKKRK